METVTYTNGTNGHASAVLPLDAPKRRGRKPGSKNKPKVIAVTAARTGFASPVGGIVVGTTATEVKVPKKRGRKPNAKAAPKRTPPAPETRTAPYATSFLPVEGLNQVIAVLAWAEAKYANKSWRTRGETASQHAIKALGHVAAYIAGTKADKESGQSPLAHAAARLMIALSL